MFSKSTLLATYIGYFSLFLLGYVIYVVLAASFFEQHTNIPVNEEDMNMAFIALGSLFQVFVMANLFRKLSDGRNGLHLGVWIGVFVGLGINLMMYGSSAPLDLTGTLVDAVLNIVLYGITGTVIGWTFKVTRPQSVS